MSIKKEQVVTKPRKGELYIGTEIECLLRGSFIEIELGRIASVYGEKGAVIYGKHDGTINSNIESGMPPVVGVELVTQPMTIDCYHNRTWKTIFERMVIPKNYAKSTLGGHVHVSKDFFSVTQLYKFLKFMRTNYHYLQYIGGRNIENNNYCKLQQQTGSSVFQVRYKMSNYDRYETINVTDFGTVELRFFASPRTAIELYKNVEWCHALSHYVKEAPLYFTVKDFHKWLLAHKERDRLYKNIVAFITTAPVPRVWKVNEEVVLNTPSIPTEIYRNCVGYCYNCDEAIMAEDEYSCTDDGYLCNDCRFFCESCGEYHYAGDRTPIRNAEEGTNWIFVCDDCADIHTSPCSSCGYRYFTDDLICCNDADIDTNMICQRCSSAEQGAAISAPPVLSVSNIASLVSESISDPVFEVVPGCPCDACEAARTRLQETESAQPAQINTGSVAVTQSNPWFGLSSLYPDVLETPIPTWTSSVAATDSCLGTISVTPRRRRNSNSN